MAGPVQLIRPTMIPADMERAEQAKREHLVRPDDVRQVTTSEVIVGIVSDGDWELLRGTMQNLLDTHGLSSGIRFFVVNNGGGAKLTEKLTYWANKEPESFENVATIFEPVSQVQAMNLPVYWRRLEHAYLHVMPGVKVEDQNWLTVWALTLTCNPHLLAIQAWPPWCAEPMNCSPDRFFDGAPGLGYLALFHPRAVDGLGMFSETIDEAMPALLDYGDRVRATGSWVWNDMHLAWDCEGHRGESPYQLKLSKYEALRRECVVEKRFYPRYQSQGLDRKRYKLLFDPLRGRHA